MIILISIFDFKLFLRILWIIYKHDWSWKFKLYSLKVNDYSLKFKDFSLKFKSYCLKFKEKCWNYTVTFNPMAQNEIGISFHHQQHMKFERDRAKSVDCIVSTRFHRQIPKIDLHLLPQVTKSIRFLFSSPTTYIKVCKSSGKVCSFYHAHNVLYTECKSWPWPLIPRPKISRVPLHILLKLACDVWK